MNIVRHGTLAKSLGADVAIATFTGKDSHGEKWFKHGLPVIKWDERSENDVCVIPDLYSERVNEAPGPSIVYQQTPLQLYNNFDYRRKDVEIWTDSPFMLAKCQEMYPGITIPIVPNIVDNAVFPFIPQNERMEGRVIVFPRKGDEFIQEVFSEYSQSGNTFWKPKVLDKLNFEELAAQFKFAQAFFASADVEGCALPPQESMSAGVVVIGKNAGGANFSMRHLETAYVAQDVSESVAGLVELEDSSLREKLSKSAHTFISQYFPDAKPKELWIETINKYS